MNTEQFNLDLFLCFIPMFIATKNIQNSRYKRGLDTYFSRVCHMFFTSLRLNNSCVVAKYNFFKMIVFCKLKQQFFLNKFNQKIDEKNKLVAR